MLHYTNSIKKSKKSKQVHLLSRIKSGKNLNDLVINSDMFQFEHDDDYDKRSISAMKEILETLKHDVVRLYDSDPLKRLEIEQELNQEIQGLYKFGYYLFGNKRIVSNKTANPNLQMTICTIYMSHKRSAKITTDKKGNMIIPALLTEAIS